jgi:hypothetical protein
MPGCAVLKREDEDSWRNWIDFLDSNKKDTFMARSPSMFFRRSRWKKDGVSWAL